jgi:hypothetical protein
MSRPRLYLVPNQHQPQAKSGLDAVEAPVSDQHTVEDRNSEAPRRRRKIKATSIPRDWQLALPFDDNPIGPTVVIVPMAAMTGSTFRQLIQDRCPNSAVDLRELIRFDLPGTSREDVFKVLQNQNTYYVKDPLPWHQLDARSLSTMDAPVSNLLVHEIVDRGANCIFVLVYRQAEAISIASHLTKVLSARLSCPWHIEEAGA